MPNPITFGLEIEVPDLPRKFGHSNPYFYLTGDGSIRNHKIPDLMGNYGQREEFGAEIVSYPLRISQYQNIFSLFNFLQGYDAVSYGNCAIHIHVGVPLTPTRIYVPEIADFYQFSKETLEEEFFNVSVPVGQEHRGKYNNYLYCRPLASPQVVKLGRSFYPSHGKVSKAKTWDEFSYAYGRMNTFRNKWHPARYVGINFATVDSQENHGTVEFRMFNYTNNPRLILSWIFAACGCVHSFFIEDNPVGVFDGIGHICKLLNIHPSPYYMEIEKHQKNVYGKIDLDEHIMTHTGKTVMWDEYNNLTPEKISSKKIHQVVNEHPKIQLENSDTNTRIIL